MSNNNYNFPFFLFHYWKTSKEFWRMAFCLIPVAAKIYTIILSKTFSIRKTNLFSIRSKLSLETILRVGNLFDLLGSLSSLICIYLESWHIQGGAIELAHSIIFFCGVGRARAGEAYYSYL